MKARKFKNYFLKLAVGNAKQKFVSQTSLFLSYSSFTIFQKNFLLNLSCSKKGFTHQDLICSLLSVLLSGYSGFLDHVMSRCFKLASV